MEGVIMRDYLNGRAISFFIIYLLSLIVLLAPGVSGEQAGEADVVLLPVNYSSSDQIVTLLNKSSEELDISGFKLRDSEGNFFEFPSKEKSILPPLGVFRVHSGPDARERYSGGKDFHWTDTRLWREDKTVELVNREERVVSELDISDTDKIDRLAGCLTRKEIKLYGLSTCSHCQSQKDKFGSSVRYINYVECMDNRKNCIDAGVRNVPAWVRESQEKIGVGTKSLSRLSELAGCSYDG